MSKISLSEARELQLLLACGGNSPGPIDGLVGSRTLAALRQAQAALGLPVTGEPDTATLAALRGRPRLYVEVPRGRTPIGRTDLVAALTEGHRAALGSEPSANRVRTAVAQLQVEHYPDLRACWDHNLGNLMTGREWRGPWFWMEAVEHINGHDTPVRSKWRAFATKAEGAVGYWGRLQERYAAVLPAFDEGDPRAAAHALKAAKYFTAPERQYADAMEQLYAGLMSLWEQTVILGDITVGDDVQPAQ